MNRTIWASLILVLASSCSILDPSHAANIASAKFSINSVFKNGDSVPKQYTADGLDLSPPLNWSGTPANCKTLALICSDSDAPSGTWYHWLLFNVPAGTNHLDENLAKQLNVLGSALQGTNDFNKVGYNGPAPPPNATHHYHFRLMALDNQLSLKAGVKKDELLKAVKGHIISETELVGTYRR